MKPSLNSQFMIDEGMRDLTIGRRTKFDERYALELTAQSYGEDERKIWALLQKGYKEQCEDCPRNSMQLGELIRRGSCDILNIGVVKINERSPFSENYNFKLVRFED